MAIILVLGALGEEAFNRFGKYCGFVGIGGGEFDTLYVELESFGGGRHTAHARQCWFRILEAQMETGMPRMLYKDCALHGKPSGTMSIDGPLFI